MAVLDIAGEDKEVVQLRRQRGRDRRYAALPLLRHQRCGARRIGIGDGADARVAQIFAALPQRLHMAQRIPHG
jgi:hypothetical protein